MLWNHISGGDCSTAMAKWFNSEIREQHQRGSPLCNWDTGKIRIYVDDENTKCLRHFTKEQDGLKQDWEDWRDFLKLNRREDDG